MAAVSLLKGACILREEDTFLDYTIEVEDESFRVHKVVMASVSDYFKVMLTGGMAESQTDRVRLEELSSHVVSNMIEFIYTGEFGSPGATTEELLVCAVYLQIPAAIEECTKLLVKKVNERNCFDILTIFKTYSVENGVDKITQYIKSNIADLMQVSPPDISSNGFECFMEFWQKSEWELFLCVLEWVDVHENRRQYLNDLLSCVRFILMTLEQLSAIKQTKLYTESDGVWRDLLTAAELFHSLPIHRKVLDESKQNRARGTPVPFCYTAKEASSRVSYSMYDEVSWEEHKAHLAPSLYEGVAAHIMVNNYLIVCGSHFNDVEMETFFQGWHIFDPRTVTWSTMASMNIPRDGFGLVQHNNHLYALGGRTGLLPRTTTEVIEKYDFQTNTWEVISTKLPVALERHGSCVIGDCVYVAGGYLHSKKQHTKRHDCLNMSTNTWQSKAPVPIVQGRTSPVDVIQVMKLWGEEVLFIFERTYVMHYYSPTVDQWSVWDCFSHVKSGLIHEFCPYVIADDNTLFLHSFAYATKQNSAYSSLRRSNSGRYRASAEPGERVGCVKWTVGQKGEKITEVELDDFPVDVEEDTFGTALLSIPPQCFRRPCISS